MKDLKVEEVNNRMKLRNIEDVCTEIQSKRVEMMELAEKFGINGDETVRSSQELDLLINEYLVMQKHSGIEVKKEDLDNEIHVIQQQMLELNIK